MVDLVVATNYCCGGAMGPWSGIGPNWLGWVRAKLGFSWIPHKSTTLPHFRIEGPMALVVSYTNKPLLPQAGRLLPLVLLPLGCGHGA